MNTTNHNRGKFEGQVLARLDTLHGDVTAIFEKLDAMTERCVAHARKIEQVKALAQTNRWLVGILLSSTGLVALAAGVLYLFLK